MNSDIKNRIRSKFLKRLKSIPNELIEKVSSEICARIMSIEELAIKTANIVVYAAIQFEIKLDCVVDQVLDRGRDVYYPRFDHAKNEYEIVRIANQKTDLIPGYLGIPEPKNSLSPLLDDVDESNLIWFTPGIAFDVFGGRIGRGKGFYDSLINRYPGKKIGIGYDWQLTSRIPETANDAMLDSLITDKRYLRFDA